MATEPRFLRSHHATRNDAVWHAYASAEPMPMTKHPDRIVYRALCGQTWSSIHTRPPTILADTTPGAGEPWCAGCLGRLLLADAGLRAAVERLVSDWIAGSLAPVSVPDVTSMVDLVKDHVDDGWIV